MRIYCYIKHSALASSHFPSRKWVNTCKQLYKKEQFEFLHIFLLCECVCVSQMGLLACIGFWLMMIRTNTCRLPKCWIYFERLHKNLLFLLFLAKVQTTSICEPTNEVQVLFFILFGSRLLHLWCFTPNSPFGLNNISYIYYSLSSRHSIVMI